MSRTGLFNGASALLKNRERLGGGGNVFGLIDDALTTPSLTRGVC